MAVLGQGDPRWIVADREDGKNVNGWHWTERNITEWSWGALRTLLKDRTVYEEDRVAITISSVEDIKGNCTLYNRKSRLGYFFELTMELKWVGKVLSPDGETVGKMKGSFKVEEVDQDEDDFEVKVTKKSPSKGSDESCKPVSSAASTHGPQFVRTMIAKLRDELQRVVKAGGALHDVTANQVPSDTAVPLSPTSSASLSPANGGKSSDEVRGD